MKNFLVVATVSFFVFGCGVANKASSVKEQTSRQNAQQQAAGAAFDDLEKEISGQGNALDDMGKSYSLKAEKSLQHQQKTAEAAFDELDKEISGQGITLDEMENNIKKTLKKEESLTPLQKPTLSNIAEKKDSLLIKTKYPLENGYPVWFINPNLDGFIGAVGIAKPIGGKSSVVAQRRTAKALAMSELARTISVLIDTEVQTKKLNIDSSTLNYYETKVSTMSRHKAEEALNNFEIRDEWIDPATNELYLWLVITK